MSLTNPTTTRALLIWNPTAGRRPGRLLSQVEKVREGLRRGGWSVECETTVEGAGAGPAAERGLREGFTVLIGGGGDGTLQEIANVIAPTPAAAQPALAVLPWGTANILANALGVPASAEAAARWLLAGQARPVALGRIGERGDLPARYFLSVASVGLDAEVVHRMRPEVKRRWGKLAYAAGAVTACRSYFPAPLEYSVNGAADVADGILVGLTRFYGGRLRLGHVAAGGSIALALRGAPRLLPLQALWLGLDRLERAPGVERLRSLERQGIHISTPGRPLELDGEAAGRTPVTIEVMADGMKIWMVPPRDSILLP